MTTQPALKTVNIHASALVIGRRGLLLTGPSGSGKSMLALALIAAARRQGGFGALVSDDRVLIGARGGRLVALRPDSIAGLIEIRGSGIARIESQASAELDLAVAVTCNPEAERLPPEDEYFQIEGLGALPMIRLWCGFCDPLAAIAALVPEFRGEAPFAGVFGMASAQHLGNCP